MLHGRDVLELVHREVAVLLVLWLGDRRDLCVVGDASQTIYSFAGADPHYLLEFADRYEDLELVHREVAVLLVDGGGDTGLGLQHPGAREQHVLEVELAALVLELLVPVLQFRERVRVQSLRQQGAGARPGR
jgi:hypothetical protein